MSKAIIVSLSMAIVGGALYTFGIISGNIILREVSNELLGAGLAMTGGVILNEILD